MAQSARVFAGLVTPIGGNKGMAAASQYVFPTRGGRGDGRVGARAAEGAAALEGAGVAGRHRLLRLHLTHLAPLLDAWHSHDVIEGVPECSAADNVKSMGMVFAAVKSATEGREIQIVDL